MISFDGRSTRHGVPCVFGGLCLAAAAQVHSKMCGDGPKILLPGGDKELPFPVSLRLCS